MPGLTMVTNVPSDSFKDVQMKRACLSQPLLIALVIAGDQYPSPHRVVWHFCFVWHEGLRLVRLAQGQGSAHQRDQHAPPTSLMNAGFTNEGKADAMTCATFFCYERSLAPALLLPPYGRRL